MNEKFSNKFPNQLKSLVFPMDIRYAIQLWDIIQFHFHVVALDICHSRFHTYGFHIVFHVSVWQNLYRPWATYSLYWIWICRWFLGQDCPENFAYYDAEFLKDNWWFSWNRKTYFLESQATYFVHSIFFCNRNKIKTCCRR